MNKLNKLFLGVLSVGLLACGGGGGGGYYSYTPVNKVQSFVNLLNDRYYSDSYFYVVKEPHETMTEGFVVVYSDETGYTAYDIANYSPGESWESYSLTAEYSPVYIHRTESDWYGDTFYFGDAYTNGYFYQSYQGEFVFDETSETSKDLETAKSIREAHKIAKIGSSLAAEYGLSQERGEEIAKLANSWKKLSSSRSLTDADANAFSKDLLGVDISKATSAMVKYELGNAKEFNEVVEVAAQANDTTPENMKEIVKNILQ